MSFQRVDMSHLRAHCNVAVHPDARISFADVISCTAKPRGGLVVLLARYENTPIYDAPHTMQVLCTVDVATTTSVGSRRYYFTANRRTVYTSVRQC